MTHDASCLKWLLIDDGFEVLTILEDFFQAHQIDCICCSDPRKIDELLSHTKICGVVSDYVMPHMNGLEIHDLLRKKYSLTDIPFVLLSGRIDVGYDPRIQENENTHYLPKPVNFERLLKLVAREVKKQVILLDPSDYQSYEVTGFASKAQDCHGSFPVILLDFTAESMHFEVKKNSLSLNATYQFDLTCSWEGSPLILRFSGLVIQVQPLDSIADEIIVTPLDMNSGSFHQIATLYREKQLLINDFMSNAKGIE